MLDGTCPKCGSSDVYRSQKPGGIWNSSDAPPQRRLVRTSPRIGTRAPARDVALRVYLNDPGVLADPRAAGKAWSTIVACLVR